MSVLIRPYGDQALLAETDDGPAAVLALARLAAARPEVTSVVPAACTVLLTLAAGIGAEAVRGLTADLLAFVPGPESSRSDIPRRAHVIGVHYRGPDLDAVADLVGMSREAVVAVHASARYTVAFCGFAPGFGYLTGLPPQLHVDRLAEPRTAVPVGAVAIAAQYSAVYPRASPGGWRLLGETSEVLWDITQTPPSRFAPGDDVRFLDLGAP